MHATAPGLHIGIVMSWEAEERVTRGYRSCGSLPPPHFCQSTSGNRSALELGLCGVPPGHVASLAALSGAATPLSLRWQVASEALASDPAEVTQAELAQPSWSAPAAAPCVMAQLERHSPRPHLCGGPTKGWPSRVLRATSQALGTWHLHSGSLRPPHVPPAATWLPCARPPKNVPSFPRAGTCSSGSCFPAAPGMWLCLLGALCHAASPHVTQSTVLGS